MRGGRINSRSVLRACRRSSTVEKVVANRRSPRLEGSFRHRLGAPFGDERDAKSRAQFRHLPRDLRRPVAQRVVVMGGDHLVTGLVQRDQQRGRIWSTRDGDEDAPGGWRSHGGAGWTRTTDNAIMSRALYHLSYGTVPSLASGLRPSLQLLLLLSVLGNRYALSLVHSLFVVQMSTSG